MEWDLIRDLAIALFIGALLGVERERRIAEKGGGIAGIRTFVLLSEAGALSAWMAVEWSSPWLFPAVLVAVAGLLVAGFLQQPRDGAGRTGLTTMAAGISAFLLGGLTMAGHREVAVALAILNSALMAYRAPLHAMVQRIDQSDLYAAIKLLIATFIVLPLLPRHPIDPWALFNPYRAWLLVVLISGLSLLGYVAMRLLGPERGLLATGLFGGMVSSTAVSLALARQSRAAAPPMGSPAAMAAGVALAWAVMFARMLAVIGAAAPPLLARLAPVLALSFAACGGAAALWLRGRPRTSEKEVAAVPLSNPFSLQAAIRLAALFVLVSAAVHLVRQWAPESGLLAVSALAGLTDVDAITLSLAETVRTSPAGLIAGGMLTAAGANTIVKCGMGVALGSRPFKLRLAALTGLLLAILAAGAVWAVRT